MNSNHTVRDVPDESRFVYREGGLEAQLVYRLDGKRLILVHTEVPKPLSGRGMAGRLVRAAVERAKVSGETLWPWCPFARKWLHDHADQVAGIVIDWNDPPGPRPRPPFNP